MRERAEMAVGTSWTQGERASVREASGGRGKVQGESPEGFRRWPEVLSTEANWWGMEGMPGGVQGPQPDHWVPRSASFFLLPS